jgi:phage terminase large subunit
MQTATINTYRAFAPLYQENDLRYLVFYGGRGGRKSWEIARALLTKAVQEKTLVLCTREIQNSIQDSVLRLLATQIEMLGLGWFFEIQRTTIIGRNGSEFIFKGLNGLTVDSLKSLEGVDKCWVEEAHSVSERSWQILIPTIRKQGSQILISYNPDLESDPVHQRFVVNTPPRSYVKKVSYLQNPDCPQTLIEEANYLKEVDYEAYAHIWLGEVRAHSDAQVFKGKYKVESFDAEELGAPMFGADWGFAVDPTTLIKFYISDQVLYIREEAYKVKCDVNDLPALFDRVDGSRQYVIRADNARPELISHMRGQYFKIEAAEKWPGCVEDRVAFMRSYRQIVIHPDCPHTAEEFRLYSYKVDKRTGDVLPDLGDQHNHCIDAIGYGISPLIKKLKQIQLPQNYRRQTL